MQTPDEQAGLTFPCEFPIKAFGMASDEFDALVTGIVRKYAPDLGEHAVNSRPSREGRYVAVTVTVRATSRAQLDDIYRELSACEQVIMAL